MKKKVISILLTAVLAVGALTGCGSSGNNSSQTSDSGKDLVVLRNAVMTGNLDQYAAEVGVWQGIFEEHGIDLQITEFVAGINTIDAIVNGTADIGNMADYAAVNRLGNRLNETNLQIFSELSGKGAKTGGLYVAPDYVDNLAALDGSEGFLTMTGTVSDYYVSQAIEYLGLDESKQNIINTDSYQTQLSLAQTGGASAVVATGSDAKYLEEYGWQLVATSEDMGIETGAYFLATDSYITENKEALAEYLKALYESTLYIDEHLDESAEYLEGKLGIKAEDFKLKWETYQIQTGFSEEAAQHLEQIEDWAYTHGKFDTDYEVRDFIVTDVVDIAFPENVTIQK